MKSSVQMSILLFFFFLAICLPELVLCTEKAEAREIINLHSKYPSLASYNGALYICRNFHFSCGRIVHRYHNAIPVYYLVLRHVNVVLRFYP